MSGPPESIRFSNPEGITSDTVDYSDDDKHFEAAVSEVAMGLGMPGGYDGDFEGPG